MPLVHRAILPVKLSAQKLKLNKNDCEFVAVNNGTLVNALRQLASLVSHASDIFSDVALLTEQVGRRIRSVKLRLDELEVKAELYEPKLVPVPEGNFNDAVLSFSIREVALDSDLFSIVSQPYFLICLYNKTGNHQSNFRITEAAKSLAERSNSSEGRRTASFPSLQDWKLEEYLDKKIAGLNSRKLHDSEKVSRTIYSTLPSQMVHIDVTGRGFDRMKANRRSLVIHTKKVRAKKRRNTISGSMPNKECGIQTSFSSVALPTDSKNYGADSGHWSSCTSSAQGGSEVPTSPSAASPRETNSLSTSSDFVFDDEDRSLTPQLENFTDGLVSDSDSVDTEGYFTSFRNECGFPRAKNSNKEKTKMIQISTTENEYELFGKGSTSTTASSCGTVVMRNKPDPPARTLSLENLICKTSAQHDDAGWEERVKRKSLIERVSSLVYVTPSPSSSSGSPPPLKDPGMVLEHDDLDSSRYTTREKFSNGIENVNMHESCALSETDSYQSEDKSNKIPRSSSASSSASSNNSTTTLTSCAPNLPQPDVIPDVQVIRTLTTQKYDIGKEYYSLDTVLLDSSEEPLHSNRSSSETKENLSSASASKVRGARVVLDANGEIIFSSETLRRKRRHKVSFDPGEAVRPQEDESRSSFFRIREPVYERIRMDTNEKLYERIEEIRRHNMKQSEASLQAKTKTYPSAGSISNGYKKSMPLISSGSRVCQINVLLETDLDSAIPPTMPELKNLPKIKDRLKRNESYRIATDEIPPRSSLPAINKKRMSLPRHNKKRDIPEENPDFVQHILNLSSSNCFSARSPTESFNGLLLSSDDRPSFVRRELPPTMEDISKEIYRFRKKFNIQPNPTTSASTSVPLIDSASGAKIPSTKSYKYPRLPTFPSMPRNSLTSSPVCSGFFLPYSSTQSVQGKIPSSGPGKSSNSRFFGLRQFPMMKLPATENFKSSFLSLSSTQSHQSSTRLEGSASATSLSDFKRLLQATQKKKSSISAVEVLKPKIILQTSI